WLQPWLALLALEAFEQRRLLAADVGAGAVVHDHVVIVARAAGVLAEQPRLVGLIDGGLQTLLLSNEFATHIDVTRARAHRGTRNQAALDEEMRIVPHDLAILAGAGLRLVGVDDEVARPPVRLLGHERPFQAGREARAPAAALARSLHLVHQRFAPA